MKRGSLLLAFVALLLAGSGSAAFAQAAPASTPPPQGWFGGAPKSEPPARPWRSLNDNQRSLLAPFQDKWDTMAPHRQQHLLERADQWTRLPADRQAAIRERVARWQAMTPEQRDAARQNMDNFKKLSPEQRQRLHTAFQRFRELPADKQAALVEQWRKQSPEQMRHGIENAGPDAIVPPPRDMNQNSSPSDDEP